MLILFDQGTPVAIRRAFPDHTVRTTSEEGWSTLLNGELLRVAEEAGFDVLLTTDINLRYLRTEQSRSTPDLLRNRISAGLIPARLATTLRLAWRRQVACW